MKVRQVIIHNFLVKGKANGRSDLLITASEYSQDKNSDCNENMLFLSKTDENNLETLFLRGSPPFN